MRHFVDSQVDVSAGGWNYDEGHVSSEGLNMC